MYRDDVEHDDLQGPDTDLEENIEELEPERKKPPVALLVKLGVALALLVGVVYITALFQPTNDFPRTTRIEIPDGHSLVESTRLLQEENVVRSAFLLQVVLMTQFAGDDVKAGTYHFSDPLSVFGIAEAVTEGLYGVPPVRITIHEGLRIDQVADVIHDRLAGVDPEAFITAAEGKEGFLFPETYHVPESFTAEEFVALMEETYNEQVEPLRSEIASSSLSEHEVVTLASILEREANTPETKRMVAGILFERMRIDMPLQVDAAFEYFLDKSAVHLTFDDLEIESPYNTYLNKGLPPGPIANPGLEAIKAVLEPTPSTYLYYLTAPNGTFHYAETFEEHKTNRALYLP